MNEPQESEELPGRSDDEDVDEAGDLHQPSTEEHQTVAGTTGDRRLRCRRCSNKNRYYTLILAKRPRSDSLVSQVGLADIFWIKGVLGE